MGKLVDYVQSKFTVINVIKYKIINIEHAKQIMFSMLNFFFVNNFLRAGNVFINVNVPPKATEKYIRSGIVQSSNVLSYDIPKKESPVIMGNIKTIKARIKIFVKANNTILYFGITSTCSFIAELQAWVFIILTIILIKIKVYRIDVIV